MSGSWRRVCRSQCPRASAADEKGNQVAIGPHQATHLGHQPLQRGRLRRLLQARLLLGRRLDGGDRQRGRQIAVLGARSERVELL